MNRRLKWYGAFAATLVVAAGGLVLGKTKERDYIASLYKRSDFTLLDDQGNFFRLHDLPARTLALLVFTPDGIPVEHVLPFAQFSRHVDDLRREGIEPFLVSRTNREIVKNFKTAAGFPARLLLDTGGSVGRNAGVWASTAPVNFWAYALVDHEFTVLWRETADQPLTYEKLIALLHAAK